MIPGKWDRKSLNSRACPLPVVSARWGYRARHSPLTLEHDDGWEDVRVKLPALLSVAERLCEPCKVPPDQRAEVADDKIRRVRASELGDGPWGEAGSPTVVGSTRALHHDRAGKVFSGDLEDQVAAAVELLAQRGALTRHRRGTRGDHGHRNTLAAPSSPDASPARVIAVIIEAGRPQVGAELLGAASVLAGAIGARVHALSFDDGAVASLGELGADEVTHFVGSDVAEDAAAAVVEWSAEQSLWAVLGPEHGIRARGSRTDGGCPRGGTGRRCHRARDCRW